MADLFDLTLRELEILGLVTVGKTNKAIANESSSSNTMSKLAISYNVSILAELTT